MTPEQFLATHSVFTREELRAALPGRKEATVASHLSRWRRMGRIERVRGGVYVRADGGGPHGALPLDSMAVASRMAPDAALAYHTALAHHTALAVHACAPASRAARSTWIEADEAGSCQAGRS